MSLTVDITALPDNRGGYIDLTNPTDLKKIQQDGFIMDLPKNDQMGVTHPLIHYFSGLNNLFIEYKDLWFKEDEHDPVLYFEFFMPTSGWGEIDDNGYFEQHWRLREQQVDFLLSYFEHWDVMKRYKLLIGFFDESPQLEQLLEQVYAVLNLYQIPKDRFYFIGHNFDAQETINRWCEEQQEQPIKYIVKWQMTGHVDWTQIESIARQVIDGDNITIKMKPNHMWDQYRHQPKPKVFTFLNRRPTESRIAMLYALYDNEVYNLPNIISAFPPLRFYGDNKTSENHARRAFSEGYLDMIIHKHLPHLAPFFDTERYEDWFAKMKVGKTLPGDFEYIGDVESQNIPFNQQSYIWLTCETVGDMEDTNTFFTEKVLKPMVNDQALVVFAQPGFVRKFKALGFHTCAKELGIDESYDSIENPQKRLYEVAKQISKISRMDLNELNKRWIECKPLMDENKKRVFSMLTNLKDNFNDALIKHVIKEVHDPFDLDTIKSTRTLAELKRYKNFMNLSYFEDN